MQRLLLLCALFLGLASACTDTASLFNESFAACRLLPLCRDTFGLTAQNRPWEQVAFNDLLGHVLDRVYPMDYVSICSSSASFDVWMIGVLSNWNFCLKNEIYSSVSGDCECIGFRNCENIMSGTSGYTSFLGRLLLAVFLFAILYYCSIYYGPLKNIEEGLKAKIAPAGPVYVIPRN